mmetsp:Transcript_11615/g.23535  ORF Transcript_11615/g.23535 Transcript_11615/m.23535 type:complete len:248 (-) Transcript_11615:79-822(-)
MYRHWLRSTVPAPAAPLPPEGGIAHPPCAADVCSAAGADAAAAKLLQALASGGRGRCRTQFLQFAFEGAAIPRRLPSHQFLCGPSHSLAPLPDGAQLAPAAGSRSLARGSRTAFDDQGPGGDGGDAGGKKDPENLKVQINVKLPKKKPGEEGHGEEGEEDHGMEEGNVQPAQTDEPTKEEKIAFESAREAAEEQSNIDHGLEKPENITREEEAAFQKGMKEANEELEKNPPKTMGQMNMPGGPGQHL